MPQYWSISVASGKKMYRVIKFPHLCPTRKLALPGMSEGTSFGIFAMKEPEYNMMFMSTYGALIEHPTHKISHPTITSNGLAATVHFKYKEVFSNHYRYRGAVD